MFGQRNMTSRPCRSWQHGRIARQAGRGLRHGARRGAIAALFIFFLLISVLTGALALNWSYLVTVQRHMQRVSDTMALAGAAELPDEGRLRDLASDQDDDVADARLAADRFRTANARGAARVMQVDADDVTVTPGYVPDVTARLEDREFLPTPPYNALKVTVRRKHDGQHAVAHMVNGFWKADPVDVAATSISAVDDQLIGFRPTAQATAPLLPLAVSEAAWNARADNDNNGIRELVLRLKSTDPAAATGANGALVDFGGITIDPARIHDQITEGVRQDQLPGGQLGPLGPGPAPTHPGPLSLPATQDSPSESATAALVAQLNAVAASRHPCRALPVYRTYSSGQVDIIGFVGVRVLSAEDEEHDGATQQQRLKVTLEPCYLIHTTAWTSPIAAAHNPYIYKLRLLQ